jgi:hypothetical protein
VTSFVALTKELLAEDGVEYVLSAHFNQDPLEQYFSKQRAFGGAWENPDARAFGYNNLKLIVTGSAAVRASAHGNVCVDEDGGINSDPMPRRKANDKTP